LEGPHLGRFALGLDASPEDEARGASDLKITIFDVLYFLILMGIGAAAGYRVARYFGNLAGIIAGVLAAGGFVFLMNALTNASHRRHCRKMAKKYTRIFRVSALPTDEKSVIKTDNSHIKVGDLGWECSPIRKNGLIYLEGLDEKWKLVWWAGFQPEQIELVGPKPFSQWDIYLPDKQELLTTPCPFPVQPR
jgi:hypothetical protein